MQYRIRKTLSALATFLALTASARSAPAFANDCLREARADMPEAKNPAEQMFRLESPADMDVYLVEAPALSRRLAQRLPRTVKQEFRTYLFQEIDEFERIAARWKVLDPVEKEKQFQEVAYECAVIQRRVRIAEKLPSPFAQNVSFGEWMQQGSHYLFVGHKKAETEALIAKAYHGPVDLLETHSMHRQTAHFVMPGRETLTPGPNLESLQEFLESVFVTLDLHRRGPYGRFSAKRLEIQLHIDGGISRQAKEQLEQLAKERNKTLIITAEVHEDAISEGEAGVESLVSLRDSSPPPLASSTLTESQQRRAAKQAAKKAEWERNRIAREKGEAAPAVDVTETAPIERAPSADAQVTPPVPATASTFSSYVGKTPLPIPAQEGSLVKAVPGLYEFVTVSEARFYSQIRGLFGPRAPYTNIVSRLNAALEASERWGSAIQAARVDAPASFAARQALDRALELLTAVQAKLKKAVRELERSPAKDHPDRLPTYERLVWKEFAGDIIGLSGEARASMFFGGIKNQNVKVKDILGPARTEALSRSLSFDYNSRMALNVEIDVVRADADGHEVWVELKNFYRKLELSDDPSSPYEALRGQIDRQRRALKLAPYPVRIEVVLLGGYTEAALTELRRLYSDVTFLGP